MSDFVLAEELTIPQNVIDRLGQLERRVNDIAYKSENMGKKFNLAINSMNDSKALSGLVQKVTTIKKAMTDLSEIGGVGFLNLTSDAEKSAEKITSVANAFGQMTAQQTSVAGLVEELRKLNDVIANGGIKDLGNQSKGGNNALKKNIDQQKEEVKSYEKALEKADNASSINERANAIQKLIKVRNALSNTDAEYALKLETLNSKIRELNRLNKESKKTDEELANEKETTNRRILNAERKRLAQQAKEMAMREKLAMQKQKEYESTPKGALESADKARTYTQRAQAMRNLETAIKRLDSADANYQKNLRKLSETYHKLDDEQKKVEASLGRIREKQSQVGDVAGQLARKLALVFSISQIQGYIGKIVRVRGEFEKQNIALGSILQNKDQADKLFGQIQALAVKSPFTVMELSSYTKQLSAYQVKYEELYDTTKRLADVSAGLGVDMQRLILAFGQVKAANYLRGTEVRQFTEAGLNILGELAKKYSELEGKIVSVGEVQERVTKRMVSFEDVSDVFDRITKDGGLFYNMQEKLSESLAGQMSNLHDSIDIMLNDIGNANNGVLKFFINLVKTLIENWETFANILSGVSVALIGYAIQAIGASRKTGLFSMSVAEAKASLYGMQLALFKVGNAFKSFLAFAKSNWMIAVIGAVVMASQQLIDHVKHVEETKAKYDVLTRSLQKDEDALNNLVNSIKRNESIIENLEIEISGLEKGTKELSDTQEDLNILQGEQAKLLNELKTKYPEVYNEMVNSKNKIEKLTEAQKEYNEELRKSGALNAIMKESIGFFSDDINKAFENYKEAYSENQKTEQKRMDNLSAFMSNLKGLGRMDESLFSTDQYKQIEAIYKSSKKIAVKWEEIGNIVRNNPIFSDNKGNSFNAKDKDVGWIFHVWNRFNYTAERDLDNTEQELKQHFKRAFDFINAEYGVTNKETFGKLDEDSQKEAKKVVKTFFDALDDINNKIVRDFINNEFTIKFGFQLYSQNEKKSFDDLRKDINDYVSSKGLGKTYDIRKIGIEENVAKYFEYVEGIYESSLKDIEKYNTAKYQYGKESNKKLAKNKEEEVKILSDFAKRYGYIFDKEKKDGLKREHKMEMLFKKRIELLKKANQEYEKLRKYKSESESHDKVNKDFFNAFSKLHLSDAFINSLEFNKQGLIDSIIKLVEDGGERFKEEAEKAVSPIRSELELELNKSEFDKAKENIENLFGDYELSLQFDEAGFDVGALKDFLRSVGSTEFEISELELPQLDSNEYFDILRNKINELRAKGGEEDIKQANESEKKLTELMLKEAQKRYKELFELRKKFATNEQQIAELELKKEELQRQSFVAGQRGEDAEMERLALKIREVDNEILRLKTDLLQTTEFWKKVFGDLSDYSEITLDALIKKTREVLNNAKPQMENGEIKNYTLQFEDLDGTVKDVSLTIAQYQQLLKKQNQLEENLAKQNPIKAILNTFKDFKGKEKNADFFKKLGGLFDELNEQSKELALNIANIFGASDDSMKKIEGVFDIIGGAKDLGVGIARISTGDIWGGVTQAVGGLSKAINAFREIHDRKLQKQIDQQKEKVEALQHAYEKLKKAIDNALSIDAKSTNYEKAIANIDAQIASTYKMIALEEDKKKKDKDAIKDYRQQIEDLQEMKAELKEKALSDVGGFGSLEDVKSAANDFAKAWLDAYKETGDGIDALNKKWDEYIDNIIASQLMMKGTEKFLKPLIDYVDKSLEDFNFTPDEASKLQEMIEKSVPELNKFWKSIMGAYEGLTTAPKLGGLSKGIQSITEQTAQALEALLNSIRYMVNEQNNKLDDLRAIYSFLINFPQNNPLLQELRLQTQQMRNMNDLWASMSKISQGSGRALKVMIV